MVRRADHLIMSVSSLNSRGFADDAAAPLALSPCSALAFTQRLILGACAVHIACQHPQSGGFPGTPQSAAHLLRVRGRLHSAERPRCVRSS